MRSCLTRLWSLLVCRRVLRLRRQTELQGDTPRRGVSARGSRSRAGGGPGRGLRHVLVLRIDLTVL